MLILFGLLLNQDPEQLGAAEVPRDGDPRQQTQAGAGPEAAGVGQQGDRQEDEQPQARPAAAPQDQGPVHHVRRTHTPNTQTQS